MGDSPTVNIDTDLADLIPAFMKRRRGDVDTLRNLLVGGDFEGIRVVGHSLKGTAAGYGFDELSRIGADIEAAAGSADAAAVSRFANEMELFLNTVRVVSR